MAEIVGPRIGPNGAGKSTTLHAIMGLVPLHAGEVRLAGVSLRGKPPEAITRAGISLVPEGRRIFGQLMAIENLRLGLADGVGGLPRTGDGGAGARVRSLPGRPGVPAAARVRFPAASSSSWRSLVAEPDVLLLDEPSLGLAPKIVDVVFDALAEIRSQGLTVLLVEQRAQRTVAFADRTYLLANGEVRLTLSPEDADDTDGGAAYLPVTPVVATVDAQTIVDAIGLGDLRAGWPWASASSSACFASSTSPTAS